MYAFLGGPGCLARVGSRGAYVSTQKPKPCCCAYIMLACYLLLQFKGLGRRGQD